MDTPRIRLEQALREPQPFEAAFELARALRDEGMSQADLYALYNELRAIHASDSDETLLDAILDTMDFISGWCSAGSGHYDPDLPPASP